MIKTTAMIVIGVTSLMMVGFSSAGLVHKNASPTAMLAGMHIKSSLVVPDEGMGIVMARQQDKIEQLISDSATGKADRQAMHEELNKLEIGFSNLTTTINLIGGIGGVLLTAAVALLASFRFKRVGA